MQDHELAAYLGDTPTTDVQRAAMHRAADTIDARWPRPDLAELRHAAFNVAVQAILGDVDIKEKVEAWMQIQARQVMAHAEMTGALIVAAQMAPESQLATKYGLSRQTIRRAVGK